VFAAGVFIMMTSVDRSGSASRGVRRQGAPAHQVVGRRREGEDPIDESPPTVAEFAQQRDGVVFHNGADVLRVRPLR
jgi:hypothetical protein